MQKLPLCAETECGSAGREIGVTGGGEARESECWRALNSESKRTAVGNANPQPVCGCSKLHPYRIH